MNKQTFSIRAALSYGWEKTHAHLSFFIPFMAGLIAVTLLLNMLVNVAEHSGWIMRVSMNVISVVVNVILALGLIKLSLDVLHEKKPTVQTLVSENEHFFHYFFASFLYAIATFIGFIFLIIPGVIIAVRLRYFGYAIIEKKMGIIDSLKESYRLTKGQTWQLFLFALAIFGINILGFIPLGLGLLITVPISIIAVAYVWKKLHGETPVTHAIELQPEELPAPEPVAPDATPVAE